MSKLVFYSRMWASAVMVIALAILLQASGCNRTSSSGEVKVGPNPKHALEVFTKTVDIRRSDVKDGMKGVDLGGLSEQQKELALKLLNEVPCDCGCRTTTVAECRKDVLDCGEGKRQAEFIMDKVKDGKSEAEIVRDLYSQILSHRFRRNVKPLLDAIGPDKQKDYMVAQLARMTFGVDTTSLRTTDNELADARATAALFLGESRKGILQYLEGLPDELYILHGVTWELLRAPIRPVFEYYFYRHRPQYQKEIMPYLDPRVSEAEMIMRMSINFFGPQSPPGGFNVSKTGVSYRGPQDAPVVLVEFSDFQCPFSRKVQTVLKKIDEVYGDKVRHIYKNFPLSFHKNARIAAQAALAAGKQGKFWEMHDKIFENQRSLSEAKLAELAKELGLDMDRFKKDMNSPETIRQIQSDMREAAQLGVSSTPTIFINDKMIKGAQGYCAFHEVIESELEK